MNSERIITSLEKKQLLSMIPKKFHKTPIYTIKATDEQANCIPCHWAEILSIFQKNNQVIITNFYDVNDELFQGKKKHIIQIFRLLCIKAAKLYGRNISYLNADNLYPLEHMEELNDMEEEKGKRLRTKRTVTSIQKMNILIRKPALYWVETYFAWLETFTYKLIKVRKSGNTYSFCIRGTNIALLTLQRNETINDSEVEELIVSGGILNKERKSKNPMGRFTFFVPNNRNALYTSLVHFQPSLPWPLYRISQGIIHQIVMHFFKKYVESLKNNRAI